jgi:hypothetical protein
MIIYVGDGDGSECAGKTKIPGELVVDLAASCCLTAWPQTTTHALAQSRIIFTIFL